MWLLDKVKNSAFNAGDPATRGGNQSSNPAAESSNRVLDPYSPGQMYVGTVVRACAGTYDVSVRCAGSTQVACILGYSMGCYYFGVNDCEIPVEGTRVVVYMPCSTSRFGVVLCAIPSAELGENLAGGKGGLPMEAIVHSIDLEPKSSVCTEAAHIVPWKDRLNMESINAHAGRPHDLFPGDRAMINEQGVGLAILKLMTSLKASDRSKIEFGVLDDMVRLVSGYYRHNSAQGEQAIYNDEGRLTQEVYGTSYQEERDGHKEIGPPNFKDSGNTKVLKKSSDARFILEKPGQCAKKRFQLYTGYLGDMVNFFVANPDPAQEPEVMDNDSIDQGLMHLHIDSSGRTIMRSASGFSFERWDRIPVPKKKHEPWDPKGDKDLEDPEEKKPFEFDEEHPYGRSLQMRDAMAWRNKSAYQRIHDQSTGAGMKDYYLPEESEMSVPDDKYDLPGKAEEKFSESDGRRAYFNVEDDGSIVMRDAWGSEILLRGGNIILNCAGNIEVRSGKSIIQMAGHDIVTKARKSVDITARDRDVRIKANVNLHMVSEGRRGDDAPGGGGVLIESKSTSDIGTNGFDGRKGEQVIGSGIVLKAEDSRVFIQGKVVHASCQTRMILEGKDPDGGPATGDIWLGFRGMIASCDRNALITAGTTNGILVSRNGASVIYGQTAAVIGGGSLALIKGSKVWIPLMEAPIDADPYASLAGVTETIHTLIQAEDDWLAPFLPPDRKDLKFTYRSSREYGTDRGTEVYRAQKFYVYRPMWAQMLAAGGSKYIQVDIEKWTEHDIDDTYVWPGEANYAGGDSYVELGEELNLGDPLTEIPTERRYLANKSGKLSGKAFHEYEVVK